MLFKKQFSNEISVPQMKKKMITDSNRGLGTIKRTLKWTNIGDTPYTRVDDKCFGPANKSPIWWYYRNVVTNLFIYGQIFYAQNDSKNFLQNQKIEKQKKVTLLTPGIEPGTKDSTKSPLYQKIWKKK